MKIQDYHAIYINLEQDKEKNKRVQQMLNALKIKNTRLDAVYGKNLKDASYRNKLANILDVDKQQMTPEFWLNRSNFKTMCRDQNALYGKIGCYLSHALALKTALDKGLNKVLILEDDFDPLENINQQFTIPQNADIFYLGGSFFHQTNSPVDPRTPHFKIDISKLKMCGTFAYILPSRQKILDTYNVFMSVFNSGKSHDKHKDWRTGEIKLRAQAADFMYINHFQTNGNAYVINPVRIAHKEIGSNIQNNRKKYKIGHFMTDTHKNKLSSYFS